jgi:hypothetical protein
MMPEIAALAGATVEVVGAVPDVRPHLAAARVVLAPVRFGTGMRGKVVEALAMGRPVVTTSVGAEGLGATGGQHLVIADGAEGFATAVRRVLDDAVLAARLGAEGRRLVETRFDWDAIAAAHEDIYAAVLRHPGSPIRVPADRTAVLAHLGARLGRWPAVGAGAALLALRGLRWYMRSALPSRAGTHTPLAAGSRP